jgi:hypothetical protein
MKKILPCFLLIGWSLNNLVAAPFAPGDIAVLRVQDNSGVLTNISAALLLDEYTTNGAFIQTIAIPTNGAEALTSSGFSVAESSLTRTPNGRWLCFGAYNAPIGITNITSSSSIPYPRTLNTVDVFGNISLAAVNTNIYNGNNIRGAASDGTNSFWGEGSGGLNYYGFDAPTSLVYSTVLRVANLITGSLYYSTSSGAGIYKFAGLPKSAATPSRIIATGSGSPYGFAINPAGNIAYMADDDQSSVGGMQRWTNSAGTWSLVYTLGTGIANTGARGLAVDWSGASPVLYASTSENSIYGNPGNRLIRIVDSGAGSAAATFATAAMNASFRGVAFAPQTGTNLTWTGVISSDWNNPGNWTTQQVPTASDYVIINSGSVTIPADGAFAIMDWSGGTISGALNVASNGVVNWTGGQLSSGGFLTVASNAVLKLSGGGDMIFSSPITNAGTMTLSGGSRLIGYDATASLLVNLPSGVVDLQEDDRTSPGNYCIYANGGIDNQGLFQKSASSGTSSLYQQFSNSGTVEADTGTISFQGGGVISGQYSAVNGAGVNFAGGVFSSVSAVFIGAGTFQFTGDSLTLLADIIPNLQLAGGTVILGANFQGGTITNLTLSGAALGGNYAVSGIFNCGGGSSGILQVLNGATMNWTGGQLSSGGFLTVASNAVLKLSGGGDMIFSSPITNAGTMTLSGGSRLIGYDATASLLVNLPSGVVDLQEDDRTSPGNYCIYANGGIDNQGLFQKSASSGTSSLYQQFSNSGTVEADTGTISFQGGYSDSSTANLAISIGSTTTGSGYGEISFSTPPSFDGTFTVSTRNGYLPGPGAAFQVLNYPSSTSSFTCLGGLDLGSGILFQPQFNPTGLTLLTTTYTTSASVPQLFINPTLGGVAITWPVGFPGWTLQSTTNLSSLVWTTVPNSCGNQAVVPISGPQQFFRLSQ